MCLPESGDGPGHTDGQVTNSAGLLNGVAVFIQVHVTICGCRCLFPIVDERVFTVHMDQHEAAAANIAALREADGQSEAGGDSGVDGIAARAQNFLTHLCTVFVGHCDRSGLERCGLFDRGGGLRLGWRTGDEKK